MLLRVNSSGDNDLIDVQDWPSEPNEYVASMVTNADQGVVLLWQTDSFGSGMAVTTGTSVSIVAAPTVAGQGTPIQNILQAQDGSFVGAFGSGSPLCICIGPLSGPSNNMVAFDASGNVRWVAPNDQPQIATDDGGVIGQSGITYDQNGNATGQGPVLTQSWTGNMYRDGPVEQIEAPASDEATPPYWSAQQGNLSANSASPLCHDTRDQLVAEYGTQVVKDASYPRPYPRFTPSCFELTNSAASQYFTFSQINVPSPMLGLPEFGWALVKNPLVVPAIRGYGLDDWRQIYGAPRTTNSGFRDPVQNAKAGGVSGSRHQFGDATDLRNQSGTPAEWANMVTAAGSSLTNTGARADFVEPSSGPCGQNCVHADWRFHDRGKYAQ